MSLLTTSSVAPRPSYTPMPKLPTSRSLVTPHPSAVPTPDPSPRYTSYTDWYHAFLADPHTAGPPPPPPPPIHHKSICAKPDMFDGTWSNFTHWWCSIILYLSGFETELPVRLKIMVVLSYMRGDNAAGRFADLYVMQGLDRITDFAVFERRLRDTFQPAAFRFRAERELLSLKQGKGTVEDFFVRLRVLLIEAQYNEHDYEQLLIRIAHNGLHNDIVEYVLRYDHEMVQNTSFSDWEAALIRASNVLARCSKRGHSPHSPAPSTRSASPSPSSSLSIPERVVMPTEHFSYPALKALLKSGHLVTDDIGNKYALGVFGDVFCYDEDGYEHLIPPQPSPDTSHATPPESDPIPQVVVSGASTPRHNRGGKRARQRAKIRYNAEASQGNP